jgi:hypothetical protein
MKKEWKICANPDCGIKFYREETCARYTWNQTRFHNRECQVDFYNKKRRGKKRHKFPEAMKLQEMHDACNKYIKGARERLREGVIVYDSKNMTQEELWAKIPSVGR